MEYKEFHQNFLDINLDFVGNEATIPNFSFGPAIRENYVIHYITSGSGLFMINGFDHQLKAGDCFILPADVETFYQSDDLNPWAYYWLGLSGRVINDLFARTALNDKGWILENVSKSEFIEHFSRIQNLVEVDDKTVDLAIQVELFALMKSLITLFPKSIAEHRNQSDYYAEKAYTFINQNYSHGIKIKDVLSHVMISRAYLFTIFKHKYGLSPQKYLIDLRMAKAAMLLIHSDNLISQISESVGFSDSLSFSSAFKKRYGVSPTKFKTQKHDNLMLKTLNNMNMNRLKK
ncbi:AraC family transcriptional regulator [Lactococcus raffinolactis]|jgi:AraC family transcriptional regulator of arabinose operon|uniref:AraC family transcriptional regulator n=1 Tax=Pseudolactococcus raffinolactis TaxID=1366 RepID=UPI00143704A3|nr:AraC family transcriptional regulator [Lactococcus raffinolactis]QIW55800.1 AraC family transcriptional regulator [Lactococcus raffinolactis]